MSCEDINISIADAEPINIDISNETPISINFDSGLPPTAFKDLTDVPHTYVGQAGKILQVNSTETGIEFTDSPTIVDWDEIGGTQSDINISGFTNDSGYLTSETDPVFTASQAANITETDITNLSNLSGTNTGDQDSADFNLADLSDVDKTSIGIGKILKIGLDGVTHEYVDEESGTDEKVKYDASDPTSGYIADKIIAGTGISVAEGTGADENKLIITNTSEGNTDHSALDNLSYEGSGHTGFQPSGNYLTSETDPLSLHLDQTTPQTISNGKPIFADGAITNLYDTSSVLSVDAHERILYANDGSSKAIEYPTTIAINFYLENALNFVMELYGGQYNFRPATTDHDNLGTSDYYWLNAWLRNINGQYEYLVNSGDSSKYIEFKTDGVSTLTDATSTTILNDSIYALGSSRIDSATYGRLATIFAGGEFVANVAGGTYSGAIGVDGYAGYFNDPTGNMAFICDGTYGFNTPVGINAGNYYAGGVQGYTGDLNDSTSTKIADVVGGIITAVYY